MALGRGLGDSGIGGFCYHPLIPVSGTGTGFDSSPIEGEGDSVGCVVLLSVLLPPLWIADQVRNDGAGRTLSCGLTSLR